jgi:sortase A
VFGVLGELSITAGVFILLFVVYTLWGTGLQTAQAQNALNSDFEQLLEQDEATPAPEPEEIDIGDAYARMTVPRFGDSWEWVIIQGTEYDDLANGPGHYIDSVNPGEVGNFSVAAHRSGHGEPFAKFPDLQVGDEIRIQTNQGEFVYELDSAPDGDPDGNRINISDTWVVDPVPLPDGEGANAEATERRITLTTCWPRWGSSHRMYATGVLVEGPEL